MARREGVYSMSDKMNTYSGKRIDPLHLREEDIKQEDIAHSLSLLSRGGGHIRYFYSVAQHSINCAKEAVARGYSDRVILGCLFHDASEAYISDIIRPVKKHLINYLEIEANIMNVIWKSLGLEDLSMEEINQIKAIDDILLENELAVMMNGMYESKTMLVARDINFVYAQMPQVEREFLQLAKKYRHH